ncbi:serine protease 55 [Dromiciops gliroides]|uniref:serine protease 55 n=1 Tax=Dromiciops gliroides TaxID=33562 RepID=UPI001CC6339F|nr:serine protease 55 [Dromiciops gliroides]
MMFLLSMIFQLPLLANILGKHDFSMFPCGQIHSNPSLKNEAAPILGGFQTSTSEVPWQVSIHFNNTFLCGGTILDNWWILTASHCFMDNNTSYLEVHLAGMEPDSEIVEKRNVTKLIFHSNFNQIFLNHDIALMLLSSPIEFTIHKVPICLTRNMDRTEECWVSGWGHSQPMKKMSISLQKVKLEILDWQECYDKVFILTENMICAWDPEGNKDSCQGDSGGPLVCNLKNHHDVWYQIGIVSWGEGCGRKGKPGIYTAVSNYLLWIVLKTREAGHPYVLSSSEYFFVPSHYLLLLLNFGINCEKLEIWYRTAQYGMSTYVLCEQSRIAVAQKKCEMYQFRDSPAANVYMDYLFPTCERINSKYGEWKKVKKIIIHSGFDFSNLDNDISLVMVQSPIKFNTQKKPICLTNKTMDWKECWVLGWGSTDALKMDYPPLQKARLFLLEWDKCHKMQPHLTKNMICAWEPRGKQDRCLGDVGGPLICSAKNQRNIWHQVGIISWGQGCGQKETPSMYTSVSRYLDWIIRETRKTGQPFELLTASGYSLHTPMYFMLLFLLVSHLTLKSLVA